jgi:hypothetical protein
MGRIATADPTLWKIVEGKLYLNCSETVKRMWEEDIPGYIEKANKNWPSLLR